MKYFTVLIVFIFASALCAQTSRVPEPMSIAVDSKDNVFVTIKYGLVKITPDGTVTRLTKMAGDTGNLDRHWDNLIVDSKDKLYANDGKLIYRFRFASDGTFIGEPYAGQLYSYKLEDGPLAAAGFNTIESMTIDGADNIYVTDSFEKIKETIGTNFVTDPWYAAAPVDTRGNSVYSVIRKISRDGKVTTLKSADGKYITANNVNKIAIDGAGNIVYTSVGRYLGRIDVATGALSNLAGKPYKRQYCPVYTPGPIATAELFTPESLIINKQGEIIFADERMFRIVKVANGRVSTLAGNNVINPCSINIGGGAKQGNQDGKAVTALFSFPHGMAYDSKGNLYIADTANHAIRKLSPDGIVTTFAK